MNSQSRKSKLKKLVQATCIIILGIVGLVLACYLLYIITIYTYRYGVATWPLGFADLISVVKEPLKKHTYLQWIVTILLILISYGLAILKKTIKGGQLIALAQVSGGTFTIFCCFNGSFESDLLYALAVGGGIFLITDGFGLFLERIEEEEQEKGKVD